MSWAWDNPQDSIRGYSVAVSIPRSAHNGQLVQVVFLTHLNICPSGLQAPGLRAVVLSKKGQEFLMVSGRRKRAPASRNRAESATVTRGYGLQLGTWLL
jgi:hypothetical protein